MTLAAPTTAPRTGDAHRRIHPFVLQLTKARYDAGIPARLVAAHTGIPEVTLSCYERGVHQPPLDRLVIWAAVFGFEMALRPKERPYPAGPVPPAREAVTGPAAPGEGV